jgi:hypothetical protein
MKDQDVTKVEFLLMCNDNIVVQRFFNVKGLNKNSHKSVEFYDYFRLFTDKLKNNLKMRSVIYMLDNQYEISVNPDMLNTSITDGPENFNVYVKIGDMTICQRTFNAKHYPPKIRYTVDLRPQLKSVLNDLTDIFSGKNFNYYYPNFNQNQ